MAIVIPYYVIFLSVKRLSYPIRHKIAEGTDTIMWYI
jgi:hypothetical protein